MPLLEPALTTPSGIGPFGNDICEIVNQHAELINTTLTSEEISNDLQNKVDLIETIFSENILSNV